MKQTNLSKLFILTALMLAFPGASKAADPIQFTQGTDILSADMNANFAELDQRLDAIEGSGNRIVPIVCTSPNQDAFLLETITDNTTYVLTGMCNGPIEIFRKRNVIIEGVSAGNPKVNGVILPGGLLANPFAAIGIYESNAELRDLKVDALAYVTDSYGFTDSNSPINAVSVGQASVLRIYDTNINGGDRGLDVWRKSYAKAYSNINITEFNLSGVTASMGSHVELSQEIQVVGANATTSKEPETLTAVNLGFIDVVNGGTFTPAGGGSGDENYSIFSGDNSTVKIRNGGAAALNGDVLAMRGGNIYIHRGNTITGYIGAYDGATIRVQGSTQSGGVIESGRNSAIRIRSVTVDLVPIPSTIAGDVSAFDSATIKISDSAHSAGNISASSKGIVTINSSTLEGDINAYQSAVINIYNSTQSNGNIINAYSEGLINIDTSTFAGDIQIYQSSLLNIAASTQSSGTFIDTNEESTINIDNTTLMASSISINGASFEISNQSFSSAINVGSNGRLVMSNLAQSGGVIDVGDGASVTIYDSNIDSLSLTTGAKVHYFNQTDPNPPIPFTGEVTGNINASTGSNLLLQNIIQTTPGANLTLSINSSAIIQDSTVGFTNIEIGSVALFTDSTLGGTNISGGSMARFETSLVDFTYILSGSVAQFNRSTVNGAELQSGAIAKFVGGELGADIDVDGVPSQLTWDLSSGDNHLNGQTIRACADTNSIISFDIAANGGGTFDISCP